ncbi:S-adenosylmethionine:tRNA ribosyltransferase-isomerase [Kitasatospora sp. CB02891]|uniref:S-adenosylmethionine:tRNA ribosyltransferase-isomerase n=1 Tax=Kitasatospora sp. CB02891 TaxID=2020329 RepID=UPI000C2733C6|nr:S-adenosylmethionine:tRNA ribosyltransferase-isomerase [Kitasatospora sp. CB02891]PJN27983.1 tRNA preQ1(34) S-adenosylmethionine ribosyltransferase-isomerase QueA [Kitasatospora sp. CB02891]
MEPAGTVDDPDDYTFDLPDDLVAQEPPEARGGERCDARLAVLRRGTAQVEHRSFRDIDAYFGPEDVLVLNNARVVPTLLHGEDAEGRVVAVSIHSPRPDGGWYCLVAPAAVCRPGAEFRLGPERQVAGRLVAEVEPGVWEIRLTPGDGETLYRLAEPIYPGYLKQVPADPEYYQNVYGTRPGAVLFPSAGRHFTPAVLDRLQDTGVAVAEVTLLIAARSHHFVRELFRKRVAEGGAGDVAAEDRVDRAARTEGFDFPRAERYEVAAPVAEAINERRARGGRVVVCGTSALRTLETVTGPDGVVSEGSGFTQLRITPGHRFRACDAFITNLHRPRSSELLLTSAFTGREPLLDVYRRELVPGAYRFHEFGDSMLIV